MQGHVGKRGPWSQVKDRARGKPRSGIFSGKKGGQTATTWWFEQMQAGGVILELNVPRPGVIRAEDIASAGVRTGQRRHDSRPPSVASSGLGLSPCPMTGRPWEERSLPSQKGCEKSNLYNIQNSKK